MPDKSPQCISASIVRKRQCDMAEYESPQELRRWRLLLRLHTNRIVIDNIVDVCIYRNSRSIVLHLVYLFLSKERRALLRKFSIEAIYTPGLRFGLTAFLHTTYSACAAAITFYCVYRYNNKLLNRFGKQSRSFFLATLRGWVFPDYIH